MTQIKICGVRTPEIALACATLGADYIGIVFCKDSQRYVSVQDAKGIAEAAIKSGVIPVAVFNDADAKTITAICLETQVTHVQLHGIEARNALKVLPDFLHKIYVVNVNQEGQYSFDETALDILRPDYDFILFDGVKAGSGVSFAWKDLHSPSGLRFFVAGGLSAENVCAAIKTCQPYAVDVSSGVELKRGEKSYDLIAQFIAHVRGK